jgi:N utilization substance protein B
MNDPEFEKGAGRQGGAAVTRRQARRDAMVVLYQQDLTGGGIEELLENLKAETGHEADSFTREDVEGVLAVRDELDRTIDAASEGWPAHRLAALERNILRLAAYEILNRPDIPVEVSIDEAVALSKRFCSREAGSLVNGILAKIVQEAGQR